VIAKQQSEDAECARAHLEAGGRGLRRSIHITIGIGQDDRKMPGLVASSPKPTQTSTGSKVEALRGKVLGGIISDNVMDVNRGDPADYDVGA